MNKRVSVNFKCDKIVNSIIGNDGETPLICACRMEHEKIVHLLLENGVNANKMDATGLTPLMAAVAAGRMIPTPVFSDKAHLNDTAAATCDYPGTNIEIVKNRIQKGADVNLRDKDGITPLMLTCYHNHYQLTKLLLEHCDCVNIASKHRFTAVGLAENNGHSSIVDLMVANGAKYSNLQIQRKSNSKCFIL